MKTKSDTLVRPFAILTVFVLGAFLAGCGGDGGSGDDLKKYVLSFDANGGDGEMEDQAAEEGTEITLAENAFTRDGYDFDGWNTEKDGKGTDYADKAKLTLAEDMTLYAQWKKASSEAKISYTVKFDANGGEGTVPKSIEAKSGEEITLPTGAFTKTGYDFKGWNTSADGKGKDYADSAKAKNLAMKDGATVTLYAKWVLAGNWSIGYELNGDEANPVKNAETNPAEYNVETKTVTLADPTRNLYEFAGWYDNAEFAGEKLSGWKAGERTGDVTLYAKWAITQASVSEAIKNIPADGKVHTVALTGEISADIITAIRSALIAKPDIKVNLDLSGTTGLTEIPDFAFFDEIELVACEALAGIVLPQGIKSINQYAFRDCSNLTDIVIPDSVKTIGNGAFNSSGLASIKFGSGLESIGEYAFQLCNSLTKITLPGSVKTIGFGAFNSCANLVEAVLEEGVQTIGENAFYKCEKLATVTIPKSMTSIEDEAFLYTGLQTVTYGGTTDEWNTFKAKIGSGNDALLNAKIICTDGTIVATSVANAASAIGELPEGTYTVTVTGEISNSDLAAIKNAINSNPNGAKVILDLSGTIGLTSISVGAFKSCTNLAGIVIPEGVVYIGDEAFFECIGLKFIHFPKTLEQLPQPGGADVGGFEGCDSIAKVSFGGTMEQFSKLIDLEYNTELFNAEMTFGDGSKWTLGKEIHDSPEEVPNVSISGEWDDVKRKMIYVSIYKQKVRLDLSGVTGLEEVTYGMFSNTKLVGIVLPQGVISIGRTAFMSCFSLESVTIPESVTSIGSFAFSGDSSLKSLIIPEGVLTIEQGVFQYCKALKTVVIPASVMSIGQYAFQETGLETVNFAGSEEDWNEISIGSDNDPLTGATINYNYTSE